MRAIWEQVYRYFRKKLARFWLKQKINFPASSVRSAERVFGGAAPLGTLVSSFVRKSDIYRGPCHWRGNLYCFPLNKKKKKLTYWSISKKSHFYLFRLAASNGKVSNFHKIEAMIVYFICSTVGCECRAPMKDWDFMTAVKFPPK